MVHTKGKNKERLQHKFMKRFLLREARGQGSQTCLEEHLGGHGNKTHQMKVFTCVSDTLGIETYPTLDVVSRHGRTC